jgi:transposase-like protein
MNATHEAIIRCDRRGRLRYTREQREAMLEAYSGSGLSGPRFAALHGVNYQTFAGWLQRRRRAGAQGGLPASAALEFVEVEAPAGCRQEGLRVMLPGGAELDIGGPAAVPLAAALIRELSRPC